jgi:hypothetical protein
MFSRESSGSTFATVVAALIGLPGALAGAAVSWFNFTSTTLQRMRVYHEAAGRVSFWDDWLKARLATATSAEVTARLQAGVQKELCVAVGYGPRLRRPVLRRPSHSLALRRWSFSRMKASICPAMPRILVHCSL